MKKILSFLRWRIILVRYLTGISNWRWRPSKSNYLPMTKTASVINEVGCYKDKIPNSVIESILSIYKGRIPKKKADGIKAPFVNLVGGNDFNSDNPLVKLAFSEKVFDLASDYFGGHFVLDSIQVLYSFPSVNELSESQMWHKDYGDNKTFHAIVYLNDVKTDNDGPFVYANKEDSKNITSAPFIRRIKDDVFLKELNSGVVNKFYGDAGEVLYVDPSVCYHYGSRGDKSRLAIFITFNSSTPYASPQRLISENSDSLLKAAVILRPDLDPKFLSRVIGAH